MATVNVRSEIVKWAHWGVQEHSRFTYSEGPDRMEAIGNVGALPISSDCSAFVTICYNWAGAPDPNGLNYNHEGYTGTLVSHGAQIALSDVLPGDVVIYGDGPGIHTALIVENGPDPLTVSMGEQGDPNYVHVSQGNPQPGSPVRFFRYVVYKVVPDPVKPPQTPVKPPSAPSPAPKPLPVPTPFRTLSQGIIPSVGPRVKAVQVKVGIKPSGIYLKATRLAVANWQKAHGLPVTGKVDYPTWKAMFA